MYFLTMFRVDKYSQNVSRRYATFRGRSSDLRVDLVSLAVLYWDHAGFLFLLFAVFSSRSIALFVLLERTLYPFPLFTHEVKPR